MGLLVDGQWHDDGYDTKSTGGRFVRQDSQFRSWVTADGSPGLTGEGGFAAAAGRYHLYVSWACPWAHRTIIFRVLKGLEAMISMSVVNAYAGDAGWNFKPGPGVVPDTVNDSTRFYEIYQLAQPEFTGRVTVPVLWDKEKQTIVNNESSEIIRMFNNAFDAIGARDGDYYPVALRDEIDELNDLIYSNINNGVYRVGFATTQEAYAEAVVELFTALDTIEQRLETRRFLTGDRITEADWRLFTTLVRFDPVYVGHFKCNLRRIRDYPNMWGYLCDLYQQPGIAPTVDLPYIKEHYYRSQTSVNPTGIVPIGPETDYSQAHNRARLGG